MKGVLVLVATVFVVNASVISKDHDHKWEAFKAQHGKKYINHKDEIHRKQIFLDNLRKFEEHNKKYDMGLVTYTVGINKFSDMTKKEFIATLTPMPPPKYSNATLFLPPDDFVSKDSVDWRTNGAVTKVKQQGGCGSCWAFSTTGTLEGALFIKTGKLPVISEQNLIDCAHDQCGGCDGGWPSHALQYVAKNGGIDSEDSYPYEGEDGKCRYDPQNSVGTVSSVSQIEKGNEQALQDAIASAGPISVCINAFGLQSYKGGIYNDPNCSHEIDHAVLAVGYGTENGEDYYIVKNSWGEHWGEHGYIRMARNKNNQCGIANYGVYPIV